MARSGLICLLGFLLAYSVFLVPKLCLGTPFAEALLRTLAVLQVQTKHKFIEAELRHARTQAELGYETEMSCSQLTTICANSLGTEVSTSHPFRVTRTSSSIRTPPQP